MSTQPNNSRTILDLKAGESGQIHHVEGHGSVRQRLLDMGLLPSQTVLVKRMAPRGGPVWIEINGTQLALRREEASVILVQSGQD